MFADRHPMYDQFRSLKGGIYVIEGIVGVGKTTLGKSIEHYLNNIGLKCKFYREYVNDDLLNQFIGNMKTYAYCFQMIMLLKRIEIYKEAEMFSNLGGVALIDRSIMGDMTFAKMHYENGNISEEEWIIYNNYIKSKMLPTPTACIHLICDVQTSIDRLKIRGVQSEINGYSSNYIIDLKTMYDTVIKSCNNVKTISLNWDKQLILDNNRMIPEDDLIIIINLLL